MKKRSPKKRARSLANLRRPREPKRRDRTLIHIPEPLLTFAFGQEVEDPRGGPARWSATLWSSRSWQALWDSRRGHRDRPRARVIPRVGAANSGPLKRRRLTDCEATISRL